MSPPANFPFASERKYFEGVLSIVSLPLTEEYITELIIYSNILSWNIIEKKNIYMATWGLKPTSPVSVVS